MCAYKALPKGPYAWSLPCCDNKTGASPLLFTGLPRTDKKSSIVSALVVLVELKWTIDPHLPTDTVFEALMKTPSKGKKVNKAWLHDHINDPYVKLAHREGYRARAAYKLKEIDETLGLIKPGQLVVDLGCTPGAWSQYVRRRMSPSGAAVGDLNGTIIALDLLPMDPIEGVTFIQGDFREAEVLEQLTLALKGRQADIVVSDMAPNLSGIASADAARIEYLVELAIEFAQNHMKPQGALVAKVFHGGSYNDVVQHFKAAFEVVRPFKPKASRDRSSETFLIGLGLKTVSAK